jgi:hypothetical protein
LPLNSGSRLLGTLSKGLAASDLPTEIHHGSGRRPPSADQLALCRSTRIALSPRQLSSRPRQRALPNSPATKAGQERKEKHRRELSRRDADLITEILRGGAGAGAPTTAATGAAAQPRLALDLADNPELYSKKNRQSRESYPKPTDPTLAPHLRHLRPASPPEGLRIGPENSRALRGYCSRERDGEGGWIAVLL